MRRQSWNPFKNDNPPWRSEWTRPTLTVSFLFRFVFLEKTLKTQKMDVSLRDWILSLDSNTQSSPLPSILLLDGGVSTHLETLIDGNFPHRCLWSSSLLLTEQGRQYILRGHQDWLDAGCDILSTVTYQCHYEKQLLQQKDVDIDQGEMKQMLKWGIELARSAITNRLSRIPKFVVASSGCYGAALADGSEYTGVYPKDVDHQTMVHFHYQKAKTLLEENPDGLAIETIPSIGECLAVCDALSTLSKSSSSSSSSCCWISFSCRNGTQINDGSLLSDALQILRDKDPHARLIHAIGINCFDTLHLPSLLKVITQDMSTHGPRRGIVFYPNSGEEWDAENEQWREGTGCTAPSDFCARLMKGVQIIQQTWTENTSMDKDKAKVPRLILGGCCRTSTATIAELRKAIDTMENTNDDASF